MATGGALPVPDCVFDLVVAYNALQVVGDMRAIVSECARVLRPSGHLCFCVSHPVTSSTSRVGATPDASRSRMPSRCS